MRYGVVWFKRDLRVQDHAPLAEAAARGPVLCLYILEPALWRQPDAAAQHLGFVRESLRELHADLRRRGLRLRLAVGDAQEMLARLHAQAPFEALYSHQETGNGASFERDRRVARWCREQGVAWHEPRPWGVVRGLRERRQWVRQWEAHMAAPQAGLPLRLEDAAVPWAHDPWPEPVSLGLAEAEPPLRQRGGRTQAEAALHGFLQDRSAAYRGGISSPLSAPDACSRLSPHLAWGTLSLREVVQATRERMADPALAGTRRHAGLAAFLSRLHWHCHFIQKLETEPDIEFRPMHPGYEGLREAEWDEARWQALVNGRTGWPLVDACVAMLRETGWLNFRMRAMLVSVAAYPLWLHWRPVGLWLARQFLDYEPGIHWSQVQMQSGTTGINTTRVYNPIKQARDQDPEGRFVRQWLPALRRVPQAWIFEPWRMPPEVAQRAGLRLGEDIPLPVVDLAPALREAKRRVHELRARPEVQAEQDAIVRRHGSRHRPAEQLAGPRQQRRAAQARQQADAQGAFDF